MLCIWSYDLGCFSVCSCKNLASADLSFRCGVRRRPLVVKSVQMLREVFVWRWICRYGAGVLAYGRRPSFFFNMMCRDDMPMDFALAASLLTQSSSRILSPACVDQR